MTPLEMIAEWRKGCSVSLGGPPEECTECTVALIDALGRALTWQPIETAPKDGSPIFIWRKGWDQAPIARWLEYPDNPVIGEDETEQAWMWGWVFHEWFTPGLEDGFLGWNEDITDGCMPTHWMPLPEPPK